MGSMAGRSRRAAECRRGNGPLPLAPSPVRGSGGSGGGGGEGSGRGGYSGRRGGGERGLDGGLDGGGQGGLDGGIEGSLQRGRGEEPLELGGGARGAVSDGQQLGAARPVRGGSGGVVVGLQRFFVGQGVPGGGQDGVLGFDGGQTPGGQVIGGLFGEQQVLDGAQVAGDGGAVEVEGAGDGGGGAAFGVQGEEAMA